MAGGRQEGGDPLEGQDTRDGHETEEGQDTRDGHETGVMVWGSG